jgi:FkbM family methyltransferase
MAFFKHFLFRLIEILSKVIPISVASNIIISLENRMGIGCGGSVAQSGEHVVLDILLSMAARPFVIFDVGANVGQYLSVVTSRLDPIVPYEIHCFEPACSTFKILTSNHGSNPNLTLNNFGLAANESEGTLYMNDESSQLASLTKRRLDHFNIHHGKLKETVKLRTIDEYCCSRGIRRIHLLKIDVEGHELEVLSGANHFISNGLIDLVQFEFGGCNIDTKTYFQDFFYFFKAHDFCLYRILPQGRLLRRHAYSESDEKFRTTNYLAINNSFHLPAQFRRIII